MINGALTIGRSPLALAIACRGGARWWLGIPGWKDDFAEAVAMARAADPMSQAAVIYHTYLLAIAGGALLSDATALRDTADALAIAERSGDESALYLVRFVHGIALVHRVGRERESGFSLLAEVREASVQKRFTMTALPIIAVEIAREKARSGDLNGAIELARAVNDDLFDSGGATWSVAGGRCLGGGTAAPWQRRRPGRSPSRYRPVGVGTDRPRVRAE
jgi:adenylate cyclase